MKLRKNPSQDLTEAFESKWDAFCQAASDAGITPIDDPAIMAASKQVFFFSDFVLKSCIRDPEMFENLIAGGDLHRRFLADEYNKMFDSFLSGSQDDAHLSILLRRVRRREMVRIAWRDLSGWSDLAETMADLSAFADACIDQTVSLLYQWQCSDYGIPTGSDGSRQKLVVLGMGKLGGQELNFSSDVDLIFAYPASGETRGGVAVINNEEFFVRLCRRLIKIIGETTSDGIVFRVDLNLRPYGESGPLVMSFDAMETYYPYQYLERRQAAFCRRPVCRRITGGLVCHWRNFKTYQCVVCHYQPDDQLLQAPGAGL
jgi:glutamate-ammonia-ligase adenylyltransferase